jgi:hypothetical protein
MYFMGSVLFLLVYNIPPLSPEANPGTVWARLLVYFRKHKTAERYRNLHISLICMDKAPPTSSLSSTGVGQK